MVSHKPVSSNNNRTIEIGVETGSDVPIYVIVRAGPDQFQNNAIFDRLDIIEASSNIGSVRYPEHEYQVDFNRNKNNEPYNEVRCFYKV